MRKPIYALYPIVNHYVDARIVWYETEDYRAACRVAQDKAMRHQTSVAILRDEEIHTIYRTDGSAEL